MSKRPSHNHRHLAANSDLPITLILALIGLGSGPRGRRADGRGHADARCAQDTVAVAAEGAGADLSEAQGGGAHPG